jgi:hypothetical protein
MRDDLASVSSEALDAVLRETLEDGRVSQVELVARRILDQRPDHAAAQRALTWCTEREHTPLPQFLESAAEEAPSGDSKAQSIVLTDVVDD